MEETEGTTKDVFGPQSLNTLKVDMHGYLDLEAMDEDSSKGEVRDAYDEELGAEDKHTATVKTIELAAVGNFTDEGPESPPPGNGLQPNKEGTFTVSTLLRALMILPQEQQRQHAMKQPEITPLQR